MHVRWRGGKGEGEGKGGGATGTDGMGRGRVSCAGWTRIIIDTQTSFTYSRNVWQDLFGFVS